MKSHFFFVGVAHFQFNRQTFNLLTRVNEINIKNAMEKIFFVR